MLLPFAELIQWCTKRQKFLEWTNQDLAEQSGVPLSTINRIKSGDYMDCKFSTIKHLLITLIGGTKDEFSCTAQVEKELRHIEELERQVANLPAILQENAEMKARLSCLDEQHRNDIRAIKAEYMEQIKFLMDELKAWRTLHQK
jgi:predicted transcriptional regulator